MRSESYYCKAIKSGEITELKPKRKPITNSISTRKKMDRNRRANELMKAISSMNLH